MDEINIPDGARRGVTIDKLQSMLKEITLNLNRLEAEMIDDGWDNEYVMIACKRIRSICYEGLRGYSDD